MMKKREYTKSSTPTSYSLFILLIAVTSHCNREKKNQKQQEKEIEKKKHAFRISTITVSLDPSTTPPDSLKKDQLQRVKLTIELAKSPTKEEGIPFHWQQKPQGAADAEYGDGGPTMCSDSLKTVVGKKMIVYDFGFTPKVTGARVYRALLVDADGKVKTGGELENAKKSNELPVTIQP